MADIRIKDLPTTASLTASDDFIAIDGTTNGTRKLNSAAPSFLTSVTTPSLTSPAATNLTLTSGLVGTNKVNFPDTLTASSSTAGAVTIGNGTAATNVAIGGGKVNIGDTTAGAANAGALVVAGGLATGAASYIGGGLTVNGPSNDYNFIRNNATNSTPQLRLDNLATENSGVLSGMTFRINATAYADIAAQPNGGVFSDTTAGFYIISRSATAAMKFVTGAYNNTPAFTLAAGSTGAATFAGAVTTGGNLTLPAASAGYRLIATGTNNTGTGQLVIQAGGGSAEWGGTLNLFETAHATKGGYVGVGLGVSGAKFTINSSGFSDSGEVASIDRSGNATFAGAVTIGNTVNTVSPTSPNRTITMVVGGVTLYIAAKTTND